MLFELGQDYHPKQKTKVHLSYIHPLSDSSLLALSFSFIDKPIRVFCFSMQLFHSVHPAIMHLFMESQSIMTQQLSVLKTRTLFPIFTIRCKGPFFQTLFMTTLKKTPNFLKKGLI